MPEVPALRPASEATASHVGPTPTVAGGTLEHGLGPDFSGDHPGGNVASGCAAILTNPNNAYYNRADPAAGIVRGLTIDACFAG